MKSRRRDSPEHYKRARDVMGASQRAIAALIVAIGFAAFGLSGRGWAFIPSAVAAVFAVVDAFLAWRGSQAAEARELAELLAGKPCRVAEARAVEYGVDAEVLPRGQRWQYINRDFEHELRRALEAALAGEGSRLVMLWGETKSGKTRAAFDALRWERLAQAWLIVPRDGARLETLLRPGALPAHWTPLIVWLDDLERYASVDAGGLNEGTFRNLECDRPVAMLATVGGRGARGARSRGDGLLIDPIAQLRDLAACIEVPVKLTPEELARAEQAYTRGLLGEIELLGLGRRMVAMNELRDRLVRSQNRSREGLAVVRAAIDWRRAGAQRPLRRAQLALLYRHYLPDDLDPDEELFAAGLRWAREPLANTEIALLRRAADGSDGFEPYDLAVEVGSREWPRVNERALARMLDLADPQDCFQMAGSAFDAQDVTLALRLLDLAERSDDRQLAATSAFNSGVLLTRGGDLPAAEAAYRRADERGGQRGAFNLGQLLRKRGELDEAEEAYRRADERGSPEGAVNLGFLLEQRGELDEAQEAYRRAEARGNRKGASNLARLLAAMGVACCVLALLGALALTGEAKAGQVKAGQVKAGQVKAGEALTGRAPMARAVAAGSVPGSIEEFPVETIYRGGLGEIAPGPEGSIWLVQDSEYLGLRGYINRISATGVVTGQFAATEGFFPTAVAEAANGAMWVTDASTPYMVEQGGVVVEELNDVGRAASNGLIETFPIPNAGLKPYPDYSMGPLAIASDRNGNMWFTDQRPNKEGKVFIGRVTPAGVVTEMRTPIGSQSNLPEASRPTGIALGANGNMWFTDQGKNNEGQNLIGEITPSGMVTEFPIPTPNSVPTAIAQGADGNMWFTEANVSKIGRITPAGTITEFPVPGVSGALNGITLAADGNMWFTGAPGVNPLGWVTPTGTAEILSSSLHNFAPRSIVAGGDGNIWFTDPRDSGPEMLSTSFVGRIITPLAPANAAPPGRVVQDPSSPPPAPAAVVVPVRARPQVLRATMTWRFAWSAKATFVKSLVAHGLAAGATVEASCHGKGCPFAHWRLPAASSRSCRRGRRCKAPGPSVAHGELDLSKLFKARRLLPGVRLTVSILQAGALGKSYLFTIQKNRTPSVKVSCLAPGSLATVSAC